MFTEKTINRFWNFVNKQREHECWNWTAYKNRDGYGNFADGKKRWNAHRVSYIIANGEIPKGLCVCHKCDNPSCVNPDHLYLGTHKQNMNDMQIRGRARKFVLNNKQKEIIKTSNLPTKKLSELFGIKGRTVAYYRKDS